MTVCVSVKVSDCIVFAADSALTMMRNGQTVNVYNNGDKIFNLHRNCAVAAMFCGMGHLDGRSISNLSKELRWELMSGDAPLNPDAYDIENVVERAHKFLADKYAPMAGDPTHGMDYFIGGYGSNANHGEVWRISIVSGEIQSPFRLREQGEHGINWGGQISPIGRLLNGMDPSFRNSLIQIGLKPNAADTIIGLLAPTLNMPLYSPSMPTTDAIRLADFLSEVTKGYYSFADGADIVGGPTDIATISKWEGFKWVKRKHYYPQQLNGSDHGHVC